MYFLPGIHNGFVLSADEARGPLLLSIDPYQDQASGCPVTELDGKVTWVGTLKLRNSQVKLVSLWIFFSKIFAVISLIT